MYLDPGFGSMILQAILAGLLGIGVIIRIFWKQIKNLFTRSKPEDSNDGDSNE